MSVSKLWASRGEGRLWLAHCKTVAVCFLLMRKKLFGPAPEPFRSLQKGVPEEGAQKNSHSELGQVASSHSCSSHNLGQATPDTPTGCTRVEPRVAHPSLPARYVSVAKYPLSIWKLGLGFQCILISGFSHWNGHVKSNTHWYASFTALQLM